MRWLALAAAFAVACAAALPVHTDVRYDERYGDDTALDVYEADGVGPHPAVMLIHGGAWIGGDKSEYTDAAKRLAKSGYVAATINYRLAPKGEYPKLVQDCLCALSYLRANAKVYHLDPDRVAVMGYSAGGHLASLIGVAWDDPMHQPDCEWGPTGAPRAVISGAGASDLRGQDNFITHELFGKGPDEIPDAYAHASPITHVGPGKPPYLLVGGDADWFVGQDQADNMRDALVKAGNDAKVYRVAGGGHITQTGIDGQLIGGESDLTAESWIVIIDFLDRNTGPRK
jgi:acetyl esterase/lipase